MKHRIFFWTSVLILLGLSAANAQDCKNLQQIDSVELVLGPNRALVPVSINGIPKLFLLDTGGDISGINGEVAKELNLSERDGNMNLVDLYGYASNKLVRIEKLGVGQLTGDTLIAVEPDPDFGKGTRFVGILAPDILGRYDIELNFAKRRMNFFLTDHCAGRVVYWQHSALAVVSFTFHKRHIRLPITLDGQTLMAEIDTGAPNISMRASVAKRLFNIVPETPGNVPLDTNGTAAAFGHIFSTLDFEGVAVKNPHVVVIPDLIGTKDPNNYNRTSNRALTADTPEDAPDIFLGMDILKKLHVYIAFGEGRVFISPADEVVPATQTQRP